MIAGIQVIGLLFGIIMIYAAYTAYKRKNFSYRSFLLWTLVWLGFITVTMLPESVYGVMQVLEIQRTADFFITIGFLMFATLLFYMYISVKTMEKKMQQLVRAVAHERVVTGKKGMEGKRAVKKAVKKTTRKRVAKK